MPCSGQKTIISRGWRAAWAARNEGSAATQRQLPQTAAAEHGLGGEADKDLGEGVLAQSVDAAA